MDTNLPNPRVPAHPVEPMFINRWSPRAFSDAEISEPELLALLEAARWAPSSYNVQPWRFIYALRNGEGWSGLLDSLLPFNAAWAQRASALLLIASYELVTPPGATAASPSLAHSFDAGAAWMQFALAAELAGWSTHAMGGFDRTKAAAAVALPPDFSLHCVIALGQRGNPATLPEALQARESPTPRRPLAETAFRARFPG